MENPLNMEMLNDWALCMTMSITSDKTILRKKPKLSGSEGWNHCLIPPVTVAAVRVVLSPVRMIWMWRKRLIEISVIDLLKMIRTFSSWSYITGSLYFLLLSFNTDHLSKVTFTPAIKDRCPVFSRRHAAIWSLKPPVQGHVWAHNVCSMNAKMSPTAAKDRMINRIITAERKQLQIFLPCLCAPCCLSIYNSPHMTMSKNMQYIFV